MHWHSGKHAAIALYSLPPPPPPPPPMAMFQNASGFKIKKGKFKQINTGSYRPAGGGSKLVNAKGE
jgi:hypothetical protein